MEAHLECAFYLSGHIENRRVKSRMANHHRGFTDEAFCPHLGSKADREIRYMFPNELHICLHSNPNGKVAFAYQEKVCLTPEHQQCPLFEEAIDTPLPAQMRREDTTLTLNQSKRPVMLAIIAILVIGGMIGMVLVNLGKNTTQPAAALAVSRITDPPPTTTRIMTPTPSPTKTSVSSATPTKTVSPTISVTEDISPTPGPAFGTPFGNFVLHQVKSGESLTGIIAQYRITIEQIEAANFLRESRTVWPDDILVIPIGTDLDPGVRFKYLLIEEETELIDLAEAYSVASEELREYNQLGPLEWVPAGRWLIIPVMGE